MVISFGLVSRCVNVSGHHFKTFSFLPPALPDWCQKPHSWHQKKRDCRVELGLKLDEPQLWYCFQPSPRPRSAFPIVSFWTCLAFDGKVKIVVSPWVVFFWVAALDGILNWCFASITGLFLSQKGGKVIIDDGDDDEEGDIDFEDDFDDEGSLSTYGKSVWSGCWLVNLTPSVQIKIFLENVFSIFFFHGCGS